MDRLLPEETILRIFSYLDAADLSRLQSVSSHLGALAKDRHLWKRLFYFTFVRPTDGPSSGHPRNPTLPTLRELRSLLLHQNSISGKNVVGDGTSQIHRLPRRFYSAFHSPVPATASDQEAERVLSSLYSEDQVLKDTFTDNVLDWERLFRVSYNWQGGKFVVSELLTPELPAIKLSSDCPPPFSPQHTIVRVSNSHIFTATHAEAHDTASPPSISVYESEQELDHLSRNQATVPEDLHAKTPVIHFSSPGLQNLLSRKRSGTDVPGIHVTEVAVDAAAPELSSVTMPGCSKRKWPDSEPASAHPVARILVAYSTGHISLFSLRNVQGTYEVTEDVFQGPQEALSGQHVVLAALHSPALVLCSSNFDVNVYQTGTSGTGSTELYLVQRMSSYRCSGPASLRLKKLPYFPVSKRVRRSSSSTSTERTPSNDSDEVAFRVTLVYSTPMYPSSWSVSIQELVLRLSLESTARRPVQVISRHTTAKQPFRPTPMDLRGRSMLEGRHESFSLYSLSSISARDPVTRSMDEIELRSRTTSLTYDDPFVVVGASDNLLEVYELLGATTFVRRGPDAIRGTTSRSATATPLTQRDALRLIHRRSLHGHTGSIHSVSLEDGRCVSGSADGSVMVWTLGDRSNETDSIASFRRNARATARGVGPRSTSSTILEEEEGDEAASRMTHVLTLRTQMELDQADLSSSAEKHIMCTRAFPARRIGPSLGQLVRSRVLDRQARGVIRWVSTAFDKIVSIVAYPDASPLSTSSLNDTSTDLRQSRERVQVWSFG
ncbi:uncharacterized protein MEPE_06370 [Melanopsichium pennsylvanicum]|uniref:F-box domain-containing protein n=2 Tax=Melanopsichium pennsylvanicum TaxID=63383 RepID=A0AAJ5C859_9BASI|nr:conserved hypothetical protein [Melanopsichium pennsylvanicum 4]SNX87660.1 uncharacterized protein MEPE_06370 [Melanopsichium pennsylvanicum]